MRWAMHDYRIRGEKRSGETKRAFYKKLQGATKKAAREWDWL
jgi:hypothetical protein